MQLLLYYCYVRQEVLRYVMFVGVCVCVCVCVSVFVCSLTRVGAEYLENGWR